MEEWENFERVSFKKLTQYATFSRDPFFDIAIRYMRPGKRHLDVGAGMGDFADRAGDKNIYLIEGNPQTAELLKCRYNNTYCLTLPDRLPFENEFFHLIHCSHLIEHLHPQGLYDVLKEFDRCLDHKGFLVISTPLLWDGFYDDLSHVRPYAPYILQKYLCNTEQAGGIPRTRSTISRRYKIVDVVYRYRLCPFPYVSCKRSWIQRIMHKLNDEMRKRYLGYYDRTGYTIALRKDSE